MAATQQTTTVGPNWGRIIGAIFGLFVLIALTVFAVMHFTSNPATAPVPEVAASVPVDPVIESLKKEIDDMRAEKAAAEAKRIEDERIQKENERLAEVQRLADEKATLLSEEIAEIKRIAAEQAEAIRSEMQAAIAAMSKVEASATTEVPVVGSEIEKLSPEKTAALLHIGTPGQGYKDPGHEGGPMVYSLSEISGTGGERIFLPNVNEGRSVSGVPGENIPAPQMKCAMPPGVTQLRWVQTSSADPKKPGNYFYGLAPY